jgi:hypothetical protein
MVGRSKVGLEKSGKLRALSREISLETLGVNADYPTFPVSIKRFPEKSDKIGKLTLASPTVKTFE